jgi:SDR family mycofactocin-dependent oxidoreductase
LVASSAGEGVAGNEEEERGMGQLDGKVAFITGAGRGQGRSHAVRLAEQGADIVAVDICADLAEVSYPLATAADLAETAALVEKEGRRVLTRQADVRDYRQLRAAADEAVAELGGIDVVVANAGVAGMVMDFTDEDWLGQVWDAVIGVNLTGVWNTVRATAPAMIEAGRGGSIVLISSTAGLKGLGARGQIGNEGYSASKHGVVGLMRTFANSLAEHSIRVNTIHPTGVRTAMIENEAMEQVLAAFPDAVNTMTNLLPVEVLDANDISDTVVFLASDAAKYITGVTLPVDAGFTAK